MAFIITGCDNILETFTSSGAVISLLGAAPNSRPFSAKLANGDTTWAVLRKGAEQFEGIVTFNTGTPNTLTQTTPFQSSNGDLAVSFSSGGTGQAFIDIPATIFEHLNLAEAILASAATCDLGSIQSKMIELQGVTGITSFGTKKNRERLVRYTGAGLIITNSATLICPNGQSLLLNTGDIFYTNSDASATPIWRVMKMPGAQLGRLIAKTAYTPGSYTHTKNLNTKTIITEVWGGGGSGGGAAVAAAGQFAIGGAAGPGGYSQRRITAPGITETVTVGAGGAAPSAGSNVGNAGGTSSFGSWCSATGGNGGVASGAGGVAVYAPGVASGAGASGDVNLTGGSSNIGFASVSPFFLAPATGGASPRGSGGGGALAGATNGVAGNAPGGGGSGGVSYNGSAAVTGGAGGAGMIIVWEYD